MGPEPFVVEINTEKGHYYAPRKISGEHIVAALSVCPSVRPSVRTSHSCPAHNFRYLKSDFETILQKWPPCWDDVSRATFRSLPWRPRSQHDLAAKSCPAHNFVIWSQILQLFYIIDHPIDTTCRAQHLGRYLEGQGHSMTF